MTIQDETFLLASGSSIQRGFFGLFQADHPAATSGADPVAVGVALAQPEAATPVAVGPAVPWSEPHSRATAARSRSPAGKPLAGANSELRGR